MFSLWKQSTTLFALQVATLLAGLLLLDNWREALSAPMMLTMAYVAWGFVSVDHWYRSAVNVRAAGLLAAAGCLLIVTMLDTGFEDAGVRSLSAGFLLGAIAFAAVAAYESSLHDRTHPWWQRFVAALPLGIGAVLGGTLLWISYRRHALAG